MGKRKLYLTLDTETATLPFVNELCKTATQKKKISIAKPLVYDIGWVITNRKGDIIKKENFLVQETFFVPGVFNTAYYKNKRPIYMNLLSKGEIKVAVWEEIIKTLVIDLDICDLATAYNAAFDFKKAIPFTEKYIKHLYDTDYNKWEEMQYKKCKRILSGDDDSSNPEFLEPWLELRSKKYPCADLWNIACQRLINNNRYKDYCLENSLLTSSGGYFKTSAETCFQYVTNEHDFIEDHTALSDAEIESKILTKALNKGKIEPEISSFPFKELGTTYDYVTTKKPKYKDTVKQIMEMYLETNIESGRFNENIPYWSNIINMIENL